MMNPKILVVEITPECNLKCKFCYNDWESNKLNSLTFDEFKDKIVFLLEELKFDTICFAGGEPLLFENLDDIILFLRNKYSHLDIGIITNGVLLSDAKLAALIKSGLSYIEVSLFSVDKNIYTDISGTNLLEDVKNNILNIQKYGINSRLAITIFNNNIDDLKDVLLFAIGAGIEFIALNPFVQAGRGEKNKNLKLRKSQLELALLIADNFASKYCLLIHITIPIKNLINEDDYSNLLFSECECGSRKLTLSPNGKLKICEHRNEIIEIDDVKNYQNRCNGCKIK